MRALHLDTPLLLSEPLSSGLGCRVWLKMDCWQPVGSFKIRGMGRLCQQVAADGARQLVCSSGGNAGYAVAYAGRELGLPVTVVVPRSTSEFTRGLIRRMQAEVLERGRSWDDAHEYALTLAKDAKTAYIHPFDEPVAWEGHATIVDEVAAQGVRPDAVVASVGGGGLLCGMLLGIERHGWDRTRVLAVETKGADSFKQAADAGRLVTLDAITSLATTLGARTVTSELLRWKARQPIEHYLATDAEAVEGCDRFLDDHRALVEPACGAALSAAYNKATQLKDCKDVLIEVCGGAGVTRELLDGWRAAC
jgi:L-serine/L-threonine ammonia-lyase